MRWLGWCAAWVAMTLVVEAGDWSQWRGPEMTGVSREKNLPSEWSLEPAKNIAWVSDVGGRATPIVQNGRVYLNSRTHHDASTNSEELINAGEHVICWDAETGEELWRDVFPVFNTDIPSARVGWAAMAGDAETGNVYLHSVSGILRCYTADGKVLWERSGVEEYGEITGYGGRLSTPLIDEDRLILAIPCLNWGKTGNPPPKHTFYAFDKNTGELLWTAAPGGAIEDTFYTNPVIAVIDGVRQLISGNGDGGVYGINARTGETLWSFPMSRRGLNASVVVDGNFVYATHGEDNIDSRAFGRVQCIDASKRGDLSETGSVWRVDGVKAGYSSPCIHDGVLYVVTDIGALIAYDAKDGTRLWQHRIGTVGKGSPVYADGKIYVMEVNGRIHIIEVSREGAKPLSDVVLQASGEQKGTDEIYASPAIANGRVYFVTRDRTICVADPSLEVESDPIPELADETAATGEIASIHVVPFETTVKSGDTIEYEVRGYDKNGRFVGTVDDFELLADEGLKGASVDGANLTTAADVKLPQSGLVNVKAAGVVATARVRSFPPLPWKWDFEGLKGTEVPAGWVNAQLKLKPVEVDGNTMMQSLPGPGKPAFSAWLGPADMTNYVIQADVMVDGKRRLSNIGVTNQRYDMLLKANNIKLALQTWSAHLRINEEMKLEKDPVKKWYTLKFAVDTIDGKCHLKGKMWPRGEDEPSEWTIETTDPQVIDHGAPGLYVYRLSEANFDNVIVSDADSSAAGNAAE